MREHTEVDLFRVTRLPADLDELITQSTCEGFYAIQRLRDDWVSGANRFDAPGERLVEARCGSRLAGICGLNCDPYRDDAKLGRLRHLYILPEFRRRGIACCLVSQLVNHARANFERVRLRTLREDADQFYVAIGFERVADEADATHSIGHDAQVRYAAAAVP
jgi:N-acetylglutamate synthase-like GNAT family acetyltransferase